MLFPSSATNAIAKMNIPVPLGIRKLGIFCKKDSPEIMVATGAVCIIGGVILACKETINAHEIIEKANKQLEEINKAGELAADPNNDIQYNARRQRFALYAQTGVKLVKTYGLAAIAIGAGLGLMIGAHKLLLDRNTALAVAYTNLLTNFQQYRARIEDKYGADEEHMLASGAETMTDISVMDENGNESASKALVLHDDSRSHSPYARLFNEYNDNWSQNPVANLKFLRAKQNELNDRLRATGILLLNDVYDELGFSRSSDGCKIGWVYDPENKLRTKMGDNYIDFGIYNALYTKDKTDFINANTPSVWLDFNVDGPVDHLVDYVVKTW